MKRILLRLVATLLVLTPGFSKAQFDAPNLRITPARPQPGQSVQVVYTPTEAKLVASPLIEATAYVLSSKNPLALTIPLSKKDKHWEGAFVLPKTALVVAFDFSNGRKVHDTNAEQGYLQLLYTNDQVLPGSRAAAAVWLNEWADNILELEPNPETIHRLFEKEFQENPATKPRFIFPYVYSLNNRTDQALLKSEAARLARQPKLTEDEMKALILAYQKLEQPQEAQNYETKIRTAFPKGTAALRSIYKTFSEEKDLTKKRAIWGKAKQQFAGVPEANFYISYMASQLATAYVGKGQWEVLKTLEKQPDFAAPIATAYNSYAWEKAEAGENLPQAERLSLKASEWAKNQLDKPRSGTDESYLTDAAIRKNRENTYAYYADTYGFILMKQGRLEPALEAMKQAAVTYGKYEEPDITQRYVEALVQAGQSAQALPVLEAALRKGKGTPKIEELFKQVYTQEKGVADYDTHWAGIKKEVADRVKATLQEMMIRKPAPAFTLTDLEGKPVSLASLQGKIVVVDFWATWCGPCIASFPGMQKAVTRYENDPDVAFLFVNTWQKEADKQKNAADFIAKNKYNFRVVLDDTDEVVTRFKVSGIPTKFVLDRKGQIRFKSSGFTGNAEATAEEVSQMVEMLREETK
ncbi:hypothetical protein BWI97_09530 [Siphonobacter sp. BAB-5405]|uniref:redoxin domain-containing protein n=1 Tax=Siphonobacter sp. BAB-5405 TaxID=1864825 RepID=UPI000C7FE70C|nr:redoxin domain-containing protein [Siphonobacter sp. BAB-5405]PMD97133.1 hypothetical protein BWI97_09530 [Siphonobacter sp. BAB-5405]